MADHNDPNTHRQQQNHLQSGVIIDQYMIERELAHGGFSSVYLARQLSDQVQVAIKEYLPRKLAHRTESGRVTANSDETRPMFLRGRALFFEEAKALATLKHHNIVEVTNFFQANETVYMVMTYDYGLTLDRIVQKKIFPITDTSLTHIFTALMKGIEVIHQHHWLHLDIKPANILIRCDNDPLLLDFGAVRRYPAAPNQPLTKVLTVGFSPIEQYDPHGIIGPWTDIYAIGASIRACLDAKIPPAAPERLKKNTLTPACKAYKRQYAQHWLQAIDWAMQIQPEDRPQNISELLQALSQ